MSELEGMGITVKRSFMTRSTEVAGVQVAGGASTELSFSLPKPSAMEARFAKEGLASKVVKIFKKELQTGDAAFDDVVYVTTDTQDATAAFLKSDAARGVIARIVRGGGWCEISGAVVKLEVAGRQETDDPDTIELVRALLSNTP